MQMARRTAFAQICLLEDEKRAGVVPTGDFAREEIRSAKFEVFVEAVLVVFHANRTRCELVSSVLRQRSQRNRCHGALQKSAAIGEFNHPGFSI